MFGKLGNIFNALKAGESLAHSETWKNFQVATNALMVLITCAVVFLPQFVITEDTVRSLATAIAIIGGIVNGYFTVATTKKIGFDDGSDGGDTATAKLPVSPTKAGKSNLSSVNSTNGGKNLLSGK